MMWWDRFWTTPLVLSFKTRFSNVELRIAIIFEVNLFEIFMRTFFATTLLLNVPAEGVWPLAARSLSSDKEVNSEQLLGVVEVTVQPAQLIARGTRGAGSARLVVRAAAVSCSCQRPLLLPGLRTFRLLLAGSESWDACRKTRKEH